MKKITIALLIGLLGVAGSLGCKENDALNATYIREHDSLADYLKEGNATNKELAAEGFVLLKNDGTFPIKKETPKVTVVGKSSTNIFYTTAGGAGDISGVEQINLKESLVHAGFDVNLTSWDFYRNNTKSGSGRTNGNSNWTGISEVTIGETPIESVQNDSDLVNSFNEYNDLCIQVITREYSQNVDLLTCDATDSTKYGSSNRHALELSQNESDLFDFIKTKFDKILIVINSANAFECDVFQKSDKVAGIIWIGVPGSNGLDALGKILTGNINPSGRTVDTWARDFTKDPTFQNFGDNRQTQLAIPNTVGKLKHVAADTLLMSDGSPMPSIGTDKTFTDSSNVEYLQEEYKVVKNGLAGTRPASYVSYEEGIYYDYRYYETMYDSKLKISKDQADDWYNGEEGVVYPFGYGLSYTKFTQYITKVQNQDNKVDIDVEVKNVGEVTGKDVVQLYLSIPYKNNGIETPSLQLVAYKKTTYLKPNESKTYTLSFDIEDFAPYDYEDKNNNGHFGYELETGEYQISCMKNAHESYETRPLSVFEKKITKDKTTNYDIVNRFTNNGTFSSLPGEKDIAFNKMSRSDMESTFPKAPTFEDRKVTSESKIYEYLNKQFDLTSFETANSNDFLPNSAKPDEEYFIGVSQEKNSNHTITLDDMVGIEYNHIKWKKFINEFTWEELLLFTERYNSNSPKLDSISKSASNEGGDALKLSYIQWVCPSIVAATYNDELATKQGRCIGSESQLSGKQGWWGPSLNIRRSPFGGNNIEYYSSDPFLTGKMGSIITKEAVKKGVYCYTKYFGAFSQETNRDGGIVYVDEQTLREIYLKPFKMVVQDGGTNGMMIATNRLGLTEIAGNYNLLTEVLRNEWGFGGSTISDMIHTGSPLVDTLCYECGAKRTIAGCNAQLNDSGNSSGISKFVTWDNHANDGIGAPVLNDQPSTIAWASWKACREAVKQHLYMIVNSNVMSEESAKLALTKSFDFVADYESKSFSLDDMFTQVVYSLSEEKGDNINSISSYKILGDPQEYVVINGNNLSVYSALDGSYQVEVVATITYKDNTSEKLACRLSFNFNRNVKTDTDILGYFEDYEKNVSFLLIFLFIFEIVVAALIIFGLIKLIRHIFK